MPKLTKEELSRLASPCRAMRLLDRVESWDDTTIRCRTRSHHDPANPLRHGARLEAVTGLEYAAQAMGVHVGLLDRNESTDGSIGYVGGLRDVVFGVDRLDECPAELTIDATRLFEGDNSFMYRFRISSGGRDVMTGRASIFLKHVPIMTQKRALVTGGSGAIGSAIAERLAADGYAVIVHAHRHA